MLYTCNIEWLFRIAIEADIFDIYYKYNLVMDDYDLEAKHLKPNNVYDSNAKFRKNVNRLHHQGSISPKQKSIKKVYSKREQEHSTKEKTANKQRKQSCLGSLGLKRSECKSQYYLKTIPLHQQKKGNNALYDINLLKVKDDQLERLKVMLMKQEQEVIILKKQIELKNQKIISLENQIDEFLFVNADGNNLRRKQIDYEFQYNIHKQNQRRLLKMLQKTTEYLYFSKFALQDSGIQFLHAANKRVKTAVDASSESLHFCNCNKNFISEKGLWVPTDIYSFGKQFIKQRKGQLTFSEYQLLLYELNKIWREREKRIINTLTAESNRQNQKQKRKINQYLSQEKNNVKGVK